MIGILDQIARSKGLYVARSLDSVFAIQLASKLADTDDLALYLRLVPQYPHAVLADAAKRVLDKGNAGSFEAFYEELLHGRFQGSGRPKDLIACAVARRDMAAVILSGPRVIDTEPLQLSSDEETARRSVHGLIARLAEDHPDASFGIEIDGASDTRRSELRQVAMGSARAAGLPVWQFTFAELSGAFSVPPYRMREHGREIVRSIWPELASGAATLVECDAAVVAALLSCRLLLHLGEEGRTT